MDIVLKLIPSPFNASVIPFRSASVSNFANAGASLNLKSFIVSSFEDFSLLNSDTYNKFPP